MTDLLLQDDDGTTVATRLWKNVPDELIQSLLNALDEPDMSTLTGSDARAAARRLVESAPDIVIDLHPRHIG